MLTEMKRKPYPTDITEKQWELRGKMLLTELSLSHPHINHLWADQGYKGKPIQEVASLCDLNLEIVPRHSPEFEILPRRWVVERTFAWLGKQRRLSKDYERLPEISETVVQVAMIPILLNRLCS